jgi:hypothetical protein
MFQSRDDESGSDGVLLFVKMFDQGPGIISFGGKFQAKNKMSSMADLVSYVKDKFKIPPNTRLRFLEVAPLLILSK